MSSVVVAVFDVNVAVTAPLLSFHINDVIKLRRVVVAAILCYDVAVFVL